MMALRVLPKLLLTGIILLGLVALRAAPAYACTCIAPQGATEEARIAEAFDEADAVFIGQVERSGRSGFGESLRVYVFSVSHVWKGPQEETIRVLSGPTSRMCGVAFERGRDYVVYASSMADGRLTTSICERTAPAPAARADLIWLEGGDLMEAQQTDQEALFIPLLILAVGGGGLVVAILIGLRGDNQEPPK